MAIMTSLAVAIPVLGMLWIYRLTKNLGTLNGAFGLIIVLFAVWHFISIGGSDHPPPDGIITCLFVMITAAMNVYCSTTASKPVNIAVNRRAEQSTNYNSKIDRRVRSSSPIVAQPDK